MPRNKCIIILSEKSSGSSACQNLLAKFPGIRHVSRTRHFENETLYWTKAASILGMPQLKMAGSEVPIGREKARSDLVALLKDNLDDFMPPENDEKLIMEGWKALCAKYAPVFMEKSPHHLCQWSALELIMRCMRELDTVDFCLIGLVRNPLATIYSQCKRSHASPEKLQDQWMTAYTNLLHLKSIVGNKLVILRYEDMVSSLESLKPVFQFCGVTADAADTAYLHSKSVNKWEKDAGFGFSLSPGAIRLSEQLGYKRHELIGGRAQPFLPASGAFSRKARKAAKFMKQFFKN